MKMISEKEEGGSKLSSWKVYYAVLSNGFLLLYKEAHVKNKVKTSSFCWRNFTPNIYDRNTQSLLYQLEVLILNHAKLILQENRIQSVNMYLLSLLLKK